MFPSRPLLILQMGRPPEDIRSRFGEQPDWFRTAIGEHGAMAKVVRPFLGEKIPDAGSFEAAIITGSWAMVTDREVWSERTARWIRTVMEAGQPLLGVCYGHQLMAHALGGEVNYHPQGREVGLQTITLSQDAAQDPLLAGFPAKFEANLTHEQSVLKPPPGATVRGRSDHDPHQILRYGPNALSVQFHPEFTPEIMRACIARRAERFEAEGLDVSGMLARLAPTPHALHLLQKFIGGRPRPWHCGRHPGCARR
ncbi:glutamine amidotransferase [Polaromonas sp. P1(28)-13]|nr:glutamine amidotransferase [Polaromonas sp. P1(28)-13]